MLLSDLEIISLNDAGMIRPAERELLGRAEGVMSFGPSSYGYDVRLSRKFIRFKPRFSPCPWWRRGLLRLAGQPRPMIPLDPRRVGEADVIRFETDVLIIQPHEFLLGSTVETFHMPSDVTGLLHDKSTLARSGISLQNTVFEAGFIGQITVEIHNQQPFPVILRAGEGIGQVLFFKGNPCGTSYADRGGKYQNQKGTVLPRA